MDYEFPRQLFPSFYNCGPPDSTAESSSGGNWGSYGRVQAQSSSGPLSSWTYTSSHQMQNFFMDHGQDAFGCMSEILEEAREFSQHVEDVVQSVPIQLLSSLLYEELTEQRDRQLFSESTTGGALDFIPFSESSSGCLLYPSHFHRVELQHHTGSSPVLNASSSLFSFQLKGPIRQISSTSLLNNCCVAVRSDHLCGVWRFSETDEPRALQVISTKEVATCVSVSPHVLGEALVASESGVVNLWTVGKGMQKVREEDSNLYFNAKSSWRWCQFSAHPRVMLYADRTGVELTDIRTSLVSGHTLFRISNSSECRSGERLIMTRYLGDAHPFHHLISTQVH
ncbi:hypothetical protein INR49_030308 [Caranx melampygus]|nr:hypothetical protein INR49_030308 [Caranx melampygus]